ncbi:MAG TPA: TonB-dependent receptor, partial [Balneolaceae bacterium]|nr:TonB-dependent receptor [Balneolaceae bacterium]
NYGGRTEGIWNFTNAELFTGLDLRVEGADGTRIREFLMGPMAGNSAYDNVWQEGQISKTGAFAEYHLHGEGINYILSTRLELNKAVINDQSTEFAQAYPETEVTEFNPSFSAGLQKIWNSQFTTGLWLGRVQRSGSLTERFINYFPVGVDPYEMIGDPNIALEVNNQIDLIFDWNTNNSALNVDLFASYLQDYISSEISTTLNPRLPTSPGVREFMNIDNAFKTGFEFNWTQNLGAGLQQQLGLAYTYAQDLENDEPLPEIPPLDVRYVLKGSFFNDLLLPEVFFRYAMKQDRVSAQYGETTTPSFTLLDLKLGYKISRSLRVNAGVNNVFDENYYEHLTRSVRGTTTPIYAPGRNMFINFSLNF